MKRIKEVLILSILAAVMLLFGTTAIASDPETDACIDGECLDGSNIFTQEAAGLELPTLKHILIIGGTDICDQELADLFGATYEKAEFTTLLGTETIAVKEAPDAVFFLTTDADTVTRTEGKPTVYLSNMKVRTVLKNLYKTVDESTLTAWIAMTDLNDRMSLSQQYKNLQAAEDVLGRDTFVTAYSYFTSGESKEARIQTAKRLLGPVLGAGLFEELLHPEEEKVYNDYIYYVFENGKDTNSGKSPSSPLLTGSKLWKNIQASRGNRMDNFQPNDRIIVRFSGHVQIGSGQTLMGMTVKTTPKTADGTRIPVIFETYDYGNSIQDKAVIFTNYTPHDAGSSRMAIYADLTLRDIVVSSEPKSSSTLAIDKLWVSYCTLTLEGAEFKNVTKTPWQLCACQNCWDENFPEEPGEKIFTHTIIFKRGVYDETTGVDHVVGNAAPYLWRDAKNGGNIADASDHVAEIIVEKGATVGTIIGMQDVMPLNEIKVNVKPGGIVNMIQVTSDRNSVKEVDNTVTFKINGVVRGEIHGLGKKTEFVNNYYMFFENAKIVGEPFREDNSGIDFLGQEGATLYGTGYISVKNSMMVMLCGLNLASGIYLCGDGAILDSEAPFEIAFEDTTVAVVSNEKLNAPEASISFGGRKSELYSDCDIRIASGLFDMTGVEDEFFTFGSVEERGLFYDYSILLGEEGKQGPAFIGAPVYIGGQPAWYGAAVSESQTDKVDDFGRLSVYVHDAVFTDDVYLLPVPNPKDSERSGVCGSVQFEVMGGKFLGKTYVANSPVYGHLYVDLQGGTFADLYDGQKESASNIITGLTTMKYENAEVLLLNGEEPHKEEPTTEAPTGEDDPDVPEIEDILPLILIIAGSILVLAAVVIVLIAVGKKKKKKS